MFPKYIELVLFPCGCLLLSVFLAPFSVYRFVSFFGSWLSDQIALFLKSPLSITSGLLSHSETFYRD